MNIAEKSTSVRAFVADETREAHESLHVHPKIKRLLAPCLSDAEYRDILLGHQRVFLAAEARRAALSMWPEFSLDRQCAALAADTGSVQDMDEMRFGSIDCAAGALGMLYALHGSQFGGKVIVGNLRKALPHKNHRFFALGTRPTTWRALVKALDGYRGCGASQKKIVLGAETVFRAFAKLS